LFFNVIVGKQGRYYGTRLNNIQRHGFFGPEDFEDDLPGLAYGAFIMQQLCEFVKDKTGYTCSGKLLIAFELRLNELHRSDN